MKSRPSGKADQNSQPPYIPNSQWRKRVRRFRLSPSFFKNSRLTAKKKTVIIPVLIVNCKKLTVKKGPLAQLARALPWHGRGQGFKSLMVHQTYIKISVGKI